MLKRKKKKKKKKKRKKKGGMILDYMAKGDGMGSAWEGVGDGVGGVR